MHHQRGAACWLWAVGELVWETWTLGGRFHCADLFAGVQVLLETYLQSSQSGGADTVREDRCDSPELKGGTRL